MTLSTFSCIYDFAEVVSKLNMSVTIVVESVVDVFGKAFLFLCTAHAFRFQIGFLVWLTF